MICGTMKDAIRLFLLLFAGAALICAQTRLIGISSVTSNLDNDIAGQAEAFQQTAPLTGTVTTMSVYLDSSNSATTVFVGLYSSANGHPQTLLASGTIASPVAGQWNTVAISPPGQSHRGPRMTSRCWERAALYSFATRPMELTRKRVARRHSPVFHHLGPPVKAG